MTGIAEQLLSAFAEHFADEALPAISNNCISNFARDGKAESAVFVFGVLTDLNNEHSIGGIRIGGVDTNEVVLVADSSGFWKSSGVHLVLSFLGSSVVRS